MGENSTPIPSRKVEMRSAGSGPVIPGQLSPEELAEVRSRLRPTPTDIDGEKAKPPMGWSRDGNKEKREREELKQPKKGLTKEYVQSELEKGISASQINKDLGLPKNDIYRHMKKWGLKSQHNLPKPKAESAEVDQLKAEIEKLKAANVETVRLAGEAAEKHQADYERIGQKLSDTIGERNHYRDLVGNLEETNERLEVDNKKMWTTIAEFEATIIELEQEIAAWCQRDNENQARIAELQVAARCDDVEEPSTSIGDPVHHPDHYTAGGIETIDFIRAKLTPEQFSGYCLGNVIKYLSRYKHKAGSEDLNKGLKYYNWLLEVTTS